jgi:hypothetical protein
MLEVGIVDGSYSWIQAVKPGVATRNLVIQPGGGNVGIGTTNPLSVLQVRVAANENLLIKDSGSGQVQLFATNDAASVNLPLQFYASAYSFPNLPSSNPGAGTKQLYYRTSDGAVFFAA